VRAFAETMIDSDAVLGGSGGHGAASASFEITGNTEIVPEPRTWWLMAAAMSALLCMRRDRKISPKRSRKGSRATR
jgi:hypothetical protein